jgi:hypothetical protein
MKNKTILAVIVVFAVLGVTIKVQMAYATSPSISDLATTPPSIRSGLEGLGDKFGVDNDSTSNDSSSNSPLDIFPGTSSNEPTAAEFDPNGTLTAVNATLNNYTNTEYGFTFLVPSDWNQSDTGLSIDVTVTMEGLDKTPETDIMSTLFQPEFTVNVYRTEPYLNPDTMTLTNYTIQEYANADVNGLQRFDPTSSITYEVTKNQAQGDAWRVEYITSAGGRQTAFDVLVLVQDPKTGYLYKLNFSTDALDAPSDLPISKKMIESFRFI